MFIFQYFIKKYLLIIIQKIEVNFNFEVNLMFKECIDQSKEYLILMVL